MPAPSNPQITYIEDAINALRKIRFNSKLSATGYTLLYRAEQHFEQELRGLVRSGA